MPAHSKIARQSTMEQEIDWNKNLLNLLIGHRMKHPEFKVGSFGRNMAEMHQTFRCKDIDPKMIDCLTEGPKSRYAVWPSPIDMSREPMIHPDDAAQGAEYCNQYEDQLDKLELTVKDYWQVRFCF
jgi:hypothetical protein